MIGAAQRNPEFEDAESFRGAVRSIPAGRRAMARDAHLVALDRGLDLLQLGFLDSGSDLFCRLAIERHLEHDLAPHGVAAGGLDLPRIEVFHRNTALDQLRLKDVPERLHLVIVLRGERDFPFSAIELDRGRRPLEVVTL